jgi:hypothetical protein
MPIIMKDNIFTEWMDSGDITIYNIVIYADKGAQL